MSAHDTAAAEAKLLAQGVYDYASATEIVGHAFQRGDAALAWSALRDLAWLKVREEDRLDLAELSMLLGASHGLAVAFGEDMIAVQLLGLQEMVAHNVGFIDRVSIDAVVEDPLCGQVLYLVGDLDCPTRDALLAEASAPPVETARVLCDLTALRLIKVPNRQRPATLTPLGESVRERCIRATMRSDCVATSVT